MTARNTHSLNPRVGARDAGLRRLRRATALGLAAAGALSVVFGELAAHAFPGRSGATKSRVAVHTAPTTTRVVATPPPLLSRRLCRTGRCRRGAGAGAVAGAPRRGLRRDMIASFPALGTTATVAVTGDRAALAAARAAVERGLDAIDRACSRFRADSELTRLNSAQGRPVAVGSLLLEAVQVAVAAARTTGGIVDPTIGRTLRLAGYDSTFKVVAGRDGQAFQARFVPTVGWETIVIDAERAAITVPAGVELDLGATAKALAADRAAHTACAAAGCGVLVALGGDIAVSGEPPRGGWAVGIADDHAAPPEAIHTTVAVESGGLATSSTTVRRWRSGERDLHHLIDPRSGRPAVTPWRTVTVAAASCVDANVASTAALVLGADAVSWLERQGLPARLVSTQGEVALVCGWPSEQVAA